MLERPTRIKSPELAHEMALAEVPFRELAAVALKQRPDEYSERLDLDLQAHKAAIAAGRRHLAELSLNLGSHDHEASREKELSKEVIATKSDMHRFYGNHDNAEDMKTSVERLWSALNHSHKELSKGLGPGMVILKKHHKFHNLDVLETLRLTQDLIDIAPIMVRGIGPRLQAVLQRYYDGRIDGQNEV